MISSAGVGSGLDVNSIVSQLMALERRPLQRIQAQKSGYEAQLSAYGKLKSAISDFSSALAELDRASDFKLFTAGSSDEDVLTATASSDAAPGSYSIEVERIAERHKMAAGDAFTYADTSSDIGASGNMSIIVGSSDPFAVDLAGKSLDEIREAINSHADNPGVTASIVNDDAGNRLVLSADDTGSENFLQVSYSGADPFAFEDINTDRDSSGAFTAADLDAVLTLEGKFTATRSSNTVDDAIQGLTLTLESAGTVELTVDRDVEGITENAQAFVDAYNALKAEIDKQRGGDLRGDNTLLSLERSLRNVFNTTPSGLDSEFSYLAEIGITFETTGKLSLDSDEFEAALQSDFGGVAELFANDPEGYVRRLKDAADDIVQSNGLIDTKNDGLDARIDSADARMELIEHRLQITEKRLRAQFTALDTLMAEFSTTGNFLEQQLSSLQLLR